MLYASLSAIMRKNVLKVSTECIKINKNHTSCMVNYNFTSQKVPPELLIDQKLIELQTDDKEKLPQYRPTAKTSQFH